MLAGDAYSSGYLVPSHLRLAYVLLVETNPFLGSNLSLFFRTMHLEYPSVLSRFCSNNVFATWRYDSIIISRMRYHASFYFYPDKKENCMFHRPRRNPIRLQNINQSTWTVSYTVHGGRFAQSNLNVLASEILKYFPTCLLCFLWVGSKCCCIDALFLVKMFHSLKRHLKT